MATSNIISVAIEIANHDGLFKLNKTESLDFIIKTLCEESGIEYVEDKYALQFIRNQSNKNLSTKYVTEENRQYIINGTELKLVYSCRELSQMIYDNLQNNGDLNWALEKLAGHINDPVFVSEVFSTCFPIIMVYVNDENLPPKLFCYCLRIILGFLKFDYIQEVQPVIIRKCIKNVDCTSQRESNIIESSLRVLEQSVAKNQYLLIANAIDIEDLIPLIWDRNSPTVQECALRLINNIAYHCPFDELKTRLLQKMNSNKFLSSISSNILYQGSDLSSDMAEQLYLYQALILNLLLDRLDPFLLNCSCLPDSELVIESKRHSNFESSPRESVTGFNTESTGSSSRNSREMSLSNQIDRINNSWKSEGMHDKRDHLVLSFLNLEIGELNKEIKHLEEMAGMKTITNLVYDCIMYFSKNYRQNYQVSLCTEGSQNFVSICQDVVNLIINDLLHVCKEHVKGSTAYYPLVFSSTKKQPFMEEFFCVAMWLFERTKREMRSRTYEDYKKVIKVMQRQLEEGLSAQPKTYHELEMLLRCFTYSSVSEQVQLEKKAKQLQFFKTSSAIKELRTNLKEEMITIIKTQRINYIIKGTLFPVWTSPRNQKGKDKFWFACLSTNKKFIMYSANDEKGRKGPKDMKSLALQDVEEFVIGKKSPHLKNLKISNKEKKEIPMGFSLITDHNLQTSLDFVTSSRKIYDYWVDALNALFGNKMKSNLFREELNTLLDMELQIQLLDVEGIDCSAEPPPIPPSPDNYDFNTT